MFTESLAACMMRIWGSTAARQLRSSGLESRYRSYFFSRFLQNSSHILHKFLIRKNRIFSTKVRVSLSGLFFLKYYSFSVLTRTNRSFSIFSCGIFFGFSQRNRRKSFNLLKSLKSKNVNY